MIVPSFLIRARGVERYIEGMRAAQEGIDRVRDAMSSEAEPMCRWTCDHCGVVNNAEKERCLECAAPRK